jgi:hypothetical protein
MDKALIDDLVKALEDPGNRFHEEEPVEWTFFHLL